MAQGVNESANIPGKEPASGVSESSRGLSKGGGEHNTWENEGARLAQCLKG